MPNPSQTISWSGFSNTLTWIKDNSITQYEPITQVYGVCFNDKNEILIIRKKGRESWQIPGGHPEGTETIEETIKREMEEEADVLIKNIIPLGVQKVDFPNNPNKQEGNLFYQARCICEVDKLLPQNPDPDNGDIWERKFVPADSIAQYITWGTTGDAMFSDAISLKQSR